ncbi:hypothetical protein [Salinisphaera hydrothermalis]|uniref:hypothetical protein n=1 Tax=Salinisphaera hydrothermalis TaxID=563188 RepID=UPI0012ECAAB7|nr:hypothetical protein [Salinisphaera hydrothermalis]
MDITAHKIRITAAALVGLGLVTSAISAEATGASATSHVTSALQNRAASVSPTFDTRSALALRSPSAMSSHSGSFIAPTLPATATSRDGTKLTDSQRSNSKTVLKYQSPYMSAPY